MSNRATITEELKTDLAAVTVANGYNNTFENVNRWKTYPGESSETFWINIKDGVNRREYGDGYAEILSIEITATFVIRSTTTTLEEESMYEKAESVIEDIIACLVANEDSYKTHVSNNAFMFEILEDQINLELDEGEATCDVTINVDAHHVLKHTRDEDE